MRRATAPRAADVRVRSVHARAGQEINEPVRERDARQRRAALHQRGRADDRHRVSSLELVLGPRHRCSTVARRHVAVRRPRLRRGERGHRRRRPVRAVDAGARTRSSSFPTGVAIVIPPHSRIVAGTHLLNPGDEMRSTSRSSLKITPIAERDDAPRGDRRSRTTSITHPAASRVAHDASSATSARRIRDVVAGRHRLQDLLRARALPRARHAA